MCETNLVKYDDSNDGWELVRSRVANKIDELLNSEWNGLKSLFKTNVEGLWEDYIESLPENAKAFYSCNACKHFITRYGGLVAIDNNGVKHSVWSIDVIDTPFFQQFVLTALNKVTKSKVVDVFVPEEKRLGYPTTGEWTHFYGDLPKSMIHKDLLKTAYQKQAEYKQDFKMLTHALLDFNIETAKSAYTLVKSNSMYRSDKVLGVARWFKDLHELLEVAKSSEQKRNLTWLAVKNAPNGFTHIRSSMIGTLLEDIQSGMSIRSVTARFEEKMNPSTYGRSQSAPTSNAILEAGKLVAKLGIEESLERKYATLDDVQEFIWKPVLKDVKKTVSSIGGVFGNVKAKEATIHKGESVVPLPTQTMTWEKFMKKVMPEALTIEALVDNTSRLMALVTAKHSHAPNILQWNNPVSWYYHGGIDGEMKKRVENAGGRYENNLIRATLIWDGYTDLDLHLELKTSSYGMPRHIFYGDKRFAGGYLDVDANGGGGTTKTPVENIRFKDSAPNGTYKFYVHNFAERENNSGTPFTLELEVFGKKYIYHGDELMNKKTNEVFEFTLNNGHVEFKGNSQQSSSQWNVNTGEFKKVNIITTSPNMWGENPVHHSGQHVFFLLDGVKDESEGKGRGFFNEMLKGELREIRKTLESFTANTPIEGIEEGNAFGLGYSSDNDWNLTLKVKTSDSEQIIKIDRLD